MQRTPQLAKTVTLFLIFGVAVGAGYVFFKETKRVHILPMPKLPSPVPVVKNKVQTTPWPSPDGKKTLTMKTAPGSREGETVYSFFASTGEGEVGSLVYTVTHDASVTMRIPFNAWSPENKYFFLEEKRGEMVIVLVFKASGENFSNGAQFLNVNDSFAQKLPNLTYKETTGWASPFLLIVNAKGNSDGKNGPSYWFDVTKQSFTRLSSDFN